jgi:hypothetical protein
MFNAKFEADTSEKSWQRVVSARIASRNRPLLTDVKLTKSLVDDIMTSV